MSPISQRCRVRSLDPLTETVRTRSADHNDGLQSHFNIHHPTEQPPKMYKIILAITILKAKADTSSDLQYLNQLPLDKLLKLKSSLQELVTEVYDNVTEATTSVYQNFGAQALAIKAPIKRTDYDDDLHKKDSKVSNAFSMSVTTLAFLAFAGYLLCLIVQAMRQRPNMMATATPTPTTFFVNAGIKKRPQMQFSYGRRRRAIREKIIFRELDLPPEEMFAGLLQLCEGFAKWSEKN